MPAAEGFEEELQKINSTKIKLTSYKIGEKYFCHISNLDPGATIARAEGASRDEAKRSALRKAQNRL